MEEKTIKIEFAKKRMQTLLNTRDSFFREITPYFNGEEMEEVYSELDKSLDRAILKEAKDLVSLLEIS